MTRQIDESLVGREEREANYRQWSERAVIVGYNSESQSYDIIITTESALGANKRSLNRTIRQVKSTLLSKTRVFSPGDAVMIGYVDEKREHPLILGGGDNAVQNPVPVTLGARLSDEPEFGFETFPFIVTDSITGSTIALTPDCDELDDDDNFLTQAIASGSFSGDITWSISGPAGCTVTLTPFDLRDAKLKIKKLTGTSPSGLVAYLYGGHATAHTIGGSSCDTNFTRSPRRFGCDDSDKGCGSISTLCVPDQPNFGPCVCGCCLTSPSNQSFICDNSGSFGLVPDCGFCGCPRPCAAGGGFPGQTCDDMLNEGEFKDCRAAFFLLGDDCCPCGIIDEEIVTATDGLGEQVSIQIQMVR